MAESTLRVTGRVLVELWGPDGRLLKVVRGENLVVDAGKELLANILQNGGANRPSHIGIGTSNAAVAPGQTALQGTELARVAFAATYPQLSGATVIYKSSFGPGVGTGTVEEAGVFNAGTLGTMLSRFLTGTFNKGAGSILDVTWSLTFGV